MASYRPEEVQEDRPASTWHTVKSILAASSGNLVEWFDFYVYSFFSVYFAQQFFANAGETGAFMSTAGVFFVGFLMRPLGGYIFGRVSDRYGRKASMLSSILLMCAGSLGMAVLPTAETVGALAPVLLTVVRCVQGISVGGEYGSTATFMSEVATSGKRGFFSSFQYVTLVGGQLLASLLAVIMTHTMGDDKISAGWWRLPFVIGAVAAIVSLWLRSGLTETTSSSDRNAAGSGSLLEVFRHPRAFWVVFGITSIGSLVFYVFTTYMQKYLINTNGFEKGQAADTMTICLLLFIIMQPLAGALSDKIGRKNSMLIFVIAMVVLPVPLLTLIGSQSSIFMSGVFIVIAMIFVSLYTSISGVVKAEMFPAHIRGLGVGFTYAIANSLFGGSAEYVALFMKDHGFGGVFPWYVVVMAVLGLIAVIAMHDNRKHSTLENPEGSAYAAPSRRTEDAVKSGSREP
ncbi:MULTISPECIES: MFS transporter [Micrococcaceae]|uniref:MFS transporter n=1 Tax=unclassified Kocuria TaxID=2649579 RepID=UPI0010125377|nr:MULTISPECIES: MFS transporter [unclassified Kocuria]